MNLFLEYFRKIKVFMENVRILHVPLGHKKNSKYPNQLLGIIWKKFINMRDCVDGR